MSGCEPSTPVSMMPTFTPRPCEVRYEPSTVAPICCMSHCRSASGSAPGRGGRRPAVGRRAGATGRPGPRPRPRRTSRSGPAPAPAFGTEPMTRFFAVPSMAACPSASAWNCALVVVTVATPTSAFSLTIGAAGRRRSPGGRPRRTPLRRTRRRTPNRRPLAGRRRRSGLTPTIVAAATVAMTANATEPLETSFLTGCPPLSVDPPRQSP